MGTFLPDDRRRSHRQWISFPVTIRQGGTRVDGVSINLSEGGMYLFAAAHLSPDDLIELEFLPPGAQQLIRICGIIRRRALYLYGIEFLTENASSGCIVKQIDNVHW